MAPPRRKLVLEELESFGWISKLPCAAELSVGLCLRGLSCDELLPRARREIAPAALHSCVEEPAGRANGTESRCAFRFLVDNYARSGWDGVFFAHDDVALNPGHRWPHAAMRNFLSANAWPAWPEDGVMKEASCGCGLVSRERLGPGYLPWFRPMAWALREWLGHEAGSSPLSGAGFQWPTAFMFGVDRATVRRRSRAFYRAMYDAASGGVSMAPRGGGPARWGAGEHRVDPDKFGHVMERLPFLLLGRPFNQSDFTSRPRPKPPPPRRRPTITYRHPAGELAGTSLRPGFPCKAIGMKR